MISRTLPLWARRRLYVRLLSVDVDAVLELVHHAIVVGLGVGRSNMLSTGKGRVAIMS